MLFCQFSHFLQKLGQNPFFRKILILLSIAVHSETHLRDTAFLTTWSYQNFIILFKCRYFCLESLVSCPVKFRIYLTVKLCMKKSIILTSLILTLIVSSVYAGKKQRKPSSIPPDSTNCIVRIGDFGVRPVCDGVQLELLWPIGKNYARHEEGNLSRAMKVLIESGYKLVNCYDHRSDSICVFVQKEH